MPKASVGAVNVRALLQIGNVILMFVGIAGSCKSIGDANVYALVLCTDWLLRKGSTTHCYFLDMR